MLTVSSLNFTVQTQTVVTVETLNPEQPERCYTSSEDKPYEEHHSGHKVRGPVGARFSTADDINPASPITRNP